MDAKSNLAMAYHNGYGVAGNTKEVHKLESEAAATRHAMSPTES